MEYQQTINPCWGSFGKGLAEFWPPMVSLIEPGQSHIHGPNLTWFHVTVFSDKKLDCSKKPLQNRTLSHLSHHPPYVYIYISKLSKSIHILWSLLKTSPRRSSVLTPRFALSITTVSAWRMSPSMTPPLAAAPPGAAASTMKAPTAEAKNPEVFPRSWRFTWGYKTHAKKNLKQHPFPIRNIWEYLCRNGGVWKPRTGGV